MAALLAPDRAHRLPSATLDLSLIAAAGLITCPNPSCTNGVACVLTSESGDVDFEPCPVCDGLGVVTGDRREDEEGAA